jgi:hypothetical protein
MRNKIFEEKPTLLWIKNKIFEEKPTLLWIKKFNYSIFPCTTEDRGDNNGETSSQ